MRPPAVGHSHAQPSTSKRTTRFAWARLAALGCAWRSPLGLGAPWLDKALLTMSKVRVSCEQAMSQLCILYSRTRSAITCGHARLRTATLSQAPASARPAAPGRAWLRFAISRGPGLAMARQRYPDNEQAMGKRRMLYNRTRPTITCGQARPGTTRTPLTLQ